MSATSVMVVLTPFLVLAGVIYTSANTNRKAHGLAEKADEIHVLVNSRLTEALDRINELEKKLGLTPGEQIPVPAIVTPVTLQEKESP